MEIRITDLPNEGIKLASQQLSLEALNMRYAEGGSDEVEFVSAPVFSGKVIPCDGGAIVTGEISFKYRQPCSLCTDPLENGRLLAINIMFRQRPEDADPTSEEYEDDLGLVYFEGDKIYPDEALLTEIIVSIPLVNRPVDDDCSECRICHRNIQSIMPAESTKNTFKSLLDAAITPRKSKAIFK